MTTNHNIEISHRYAAAFAQVRQDAVGAPDVKDIREARSALWASDFARDTAKVHEETLARVGMRGGMMRGYPRVGQAACPPVTGPGMGVAPGVSAATRSIPQAALQGYAMNPSPQACTDEVPCHAHLFGFNTFGTAGFPLAGGAAIVNLNLQPTNTQRYKPAYLFWEARDNAAGLGAVIGLLVNATINGNQQFTTSGTGVGGGIPSSAFSVDTPLDVRTWQDFSSLPSNNLVLGFNNPGAGAVLSHFLGVFWGDAIG